MNSRCSCQEGYPDQKGTQIEKLRAEVDDLKARLRAVRQLCHENPSHEVDAALERATDLRVKEWKP